MGDSLHHPVTVHGRGINKHGVVRTGIDWQLPVVDLGWQILLRLAWALQSNIRMRLQNGRRGCAKMADIPDVEVHTKTSIANTPRPKHVLRAGYKYFEHRYDYVAAIGGFHAFLQCLAPKSYVAANGFCHSLHRTGTSNATT